MEGLADPGPCQEPSRSDSDLSDSSSAADSDISEQESAGCMAALQTSLQQREVEQQREGAAIIIQKNYRTHLARLEAATLRQIAALGRANKHRRIVASAYDLYHSLRPPAFEWFKRLLRRRLRFLIQHNWARRRASTAITTAAAAAATAVKAMCPAQQQQQLQQSESRQEADTQSPLAVHQAASPEVALANSPGSSWQTPCCSSACQTVCEVGCQTDPEQLRCEGPPGLPEELLGRAMRRGGSTPPRAAGRAASPLAGPGMQHVVQLWDSGQAPGAMASSVTSPPVTAAPQSSHGRPLDSICSSPQATHNRRAAANAPAPACASKSSARSTSIQRSIETVQVALESPSSMASLAALQVCDKVKESAARAAAGSDAPPRLAKIRSTASRPASALMRTQL